MEYIESAHTYFKGEKAIAYFAIPAGVVFLIFALVILKWYFDNQVAQGLFYPLVLISIIAMSLGGWISRKSQKDIDRLTVSYKTNAIETIEKELTRIEKVNANWIKLKITWAVALIIGMVLIFATKKELWIGIALGTMIIGTMGFIVDTIAEKRALTYQAQLETLIDK